MTTVEEAKEVVRRYVQTGTSRAPARGNEPTGKSYELVAREWFEIQDGRIRRRWGAGDAALQARRLGIPPAG